MLSSLVARAKLPANEAIESRRVKRAAYKEPARILHGFTFCTVIIVNYLMITLLEFVRVSL